MLPACRGSGSDTVRANGSLVRPEHANVDLVAMPPHYDNPVFRIPIPLRLSYNKVAIALGIARGALDAFVDLAHNKVPMLSPSKLMDRPIAQIRVAECEAKYRAVRAYVMEAMAAVEDELERGAEMPSAMTTQNARLACVLATNMCMEVVDVLHNTAGTSASYMANPLERKLRDAARGGDAPLGVTLAVPGPRCDHPRSRGRRRVRRYRRAGPRRPPQQLIDCSIP